MNAYKGLYIVVHTVAFLGFLALRITGNLGIFLFILSLTAVLLSFYNSHLRKNVNFPMEYTSALGVALISYLAASYFLLDVQIFQILIHFLVLIQIIKLLGKKEISDYRQLIILAFFQFLSVSITTTGFAYGIITLIFLSLATAGVILHNICADAEKYVEHYDEGTVKGSFLKVTVPAILLTLILTSVIFVSMPRFRNSFITASFVQTNSLKTGFSDEVNLGRIGEIKRDSTPVMRVKIFHNKTKRANTDLYWRGVTLNEFDGVTWRIGQKRRNIIYEDTNGLIFVDGVNKKRLVKQEIIVEPMDTDVLFAADTPVAYQNVPYSRLKVISESQFIYRSVPSKIKYIAYSDLSRGNRYIRDEGGEYPPSVRKDYLREVYRTERITSLAKQLYDPDKTSWENSKNVEYYLQQNYTYTRTSGMSRENLPLEEFLFRNRKGHCEYFATSMAVLLQNMGIPARLVTGFTGGDYNEEGDFYIVRESHAHAWVEVYFNKAGWVRFDPSPAGAASSGKDSILLSYIELLKYKWSRYIVDFDSDDQRNLLSSLKNQLDKADYSLYRPENTSFGTYLYGFSVVLIMAVVMLGYKYRYILLYNRPNSHKASSIYNKGLGVLKKQGLHKKPYTTSTELSDIVDNSGISHPDSFREFTRLYLEARFGYGVEESKIKQLEDILKRDKRSWKSDNRGNSDY